MKTQARVKSITLDWKSRRPVVSMELMCSPADVEKLGEDIDIELKKHQEHRSKDANALLWACIGDIAAALRTDTWSVYLDLLRNFGKFEPLLVRPDAVDDLRKQWREMSVVGDKTITDGAGKKHIMTYVLCFYGSSTYNTAEFSRLLDGCLQEMRSMELPLPPGKEVQAALDAWEKKHGNHDQG